MISLPNLSRWCRGGLLERNSEPERGSKGDGFALAWRRSFCLRDGHVLVHRGRVRSAELNKLVITVDGMQSAAMMNFMGSCSLLWALGAPTAKMIGWGWDQAQVGKRRGTLIGQRSGGCRVGVYDQTTHTFSQTSR